MSRTYLFILLMSLLSVVSTSCVHEWPEMPDTRPVALTIRHELPWRLYNFNYSELTRGSGRGDTDRDLEVRYIFEVYPEGSTDILIDRFEMRRSDLTLADFSTYINLPAGKFDVWVWSDYCRSASDTGLFYDAANFGSIRYSMPYTGDSEQKDAFQGKFTVDIPSILDNEVELDYTVELHRPLTSYAFLSTDLDKFLTDEISRRQIELSQADAEAMTIDKAIRGVDFSKYKAVFTYTGYLPSEYSMFRNKPIDSMTGVSFEANLRIVDNNEVLIGFDYFFINGKESYITVSVEIYDENDIRVSYVPAVNIPVERNRATIVRGDFLTSEATGGVGINPSFTGSFDIPI